MDLENYLQQYYLQVQEVIVKKIMRYEILDGLFSIKDIHNSLFFQGGTSIRLCYNNDRYSEYLDFAMNKNQTFDRESMKYFENIFREKTLNKHHLEAEINIKS